MKEEEYMEIEKQEKQLLARIRSYQDQQEALEIVGDVLRRCLRQHLSFEGPSPDDHREPAATSE